MTWQSRVAATVVALSLAAPLTAQSPNRSDADALARRAADRMRALQQEADALAAQARTLIGDLRKLEIERELRTEELAAMTAKAQAVATELATVQEQALRLEQEDRDQRPELEARLVELYKLGQGRYWRLLLSVADARRLGEASRMVAALSLRDRDQIATHQKRREALTAARRRLEDDSRQLETLRADAERTRAAADRAVTARAQAIRSIDARRDLNAQLAGELQLAQQKLQSALRSMGSAPVPALPLAPFRGTLPWPATGRLNQTFGGGAAGRPTSNGIHIATRAGSEVRTIHDGTVAFAGPFTGYGNLVIVDHGSNAFSLYGYLRDVSVSQTTAIRAGHIVGTAGTPPVGTPDAAGLYFELRIDGRPVDPLQWLRRQ